MNIVVLMKQVPDTESELEINETGTGIESEDVKNVINPYDEYAIEEALLIKEQNEGSTVTLVSVGSDSVAESIRVAYAMGVDEAILVNDELDDEVYGGVDPFTTAKLLAAVVGELKFDLLIAGQRSVDGDNYQTPAWLAEMLDIPLVTGVIHQEIEGDTITCKKLIDGGTATVKTSLPMLFTAQKGLNEPRYPAFRAIMKAKQQSYEEKELEDIGLDEDAVGRDAALVRVRSLQLTPQRSGGMVIEGGSPAEKAANLVKILIEKHQLF